MGKPEHGVVIHIDEEEDLGARLATDLYFFFVRKTIDHFEIHTSDGTLDIEGFIRDGERRLVRLVDRG